MILFISTPEILFALFVAILIFGTDKIPEIARAMGKGMRQLRDATNDIKNEINKSADKAGIHTDFVQDIENEIQQVKEEINDPLGRIKRSN